MVLQRQLWESFPKWSVQCSYLHEDNRSNNSFFTNLNWAKYIQRRRYISFWFDTINTSARIHNVLLAILIFEKFAYTLNFTVMPDSTIIFPLGIFVTIFLNAQLWLAIYNIIWFGYSVPKGILNFFFLEFIMFHIHTSVFAFVILFFLLHFFCFASSLC